ncbi:hypothetical protein R6Q59_035255 [Mikania micrantha]
MIVVITWLIKVVRDMALYKHGISPYETYSWQRRRLGGAPETWWTAGGGGGGGSNLMERSFITILSHSHSHYLVFLVRIELFSVSIVVMKFRRMLWMMILVAVPSTKIIIAKAVESLETSEIRIQVEPSLILRQEEMLKLLIGFLLRTTEAIHLLGA